MPVAKAPTVHCLFDRMVPLSELNSHPKNRNEHPKDQVERLANILEYQGWRYPVKVSKRSGFVTSGHGRIEAAKLKGWSAVPVNFQEYPSDEAEYADLTADNAIASWSELDMSGINTDLGDLGPDFNLDMLGLKGFGIDPPEGGGQGMMVQCPHCQESFAAKGRVKRGKISIEQGDG